MVAMEIIATMGTERVINAAVSYLIIDISTILRLKALSHTTAYGPSVCEGMNIFAHTLTYARGKLFIRCIF